MKRVLFLTPLALAAMTGCAPKASQIQAGQWEVTTQLVSVELPASMAEQQAQARNQIGIVQSSPAQCLSDDEAHNFVQNMRRAPPNCVVSDETYAGGVMRTKVQCPAGPGQPAVTLTLEGNYSATTFNATISEEVTNPTATQGTMRRVQRLRGRRIGDCTAPPPAAMPAMPIPEPASPPQSAPAAPPQPRS